MIVYVVVLLEDSEVQDEVRQWSFGLPYIICLGSDIYGRPQHEIMDT